jgi:hypothetical protein
MHKSKRINIRIGRFQKLMLFWTVKIRVIDFEGFTHPSCDPGKLKKNTQMASKTIPNVMLLTSRQESTKLYKRSRDGPEKRPKGPWNGAKTCRGPLKWSLDIQVRIFNRFRQPFGTVSAQMVNKNPLKIPSKIMDKSKRINIENLWQTDPQIEVKACLKQMPLSCQICNYEKIGKFQKLMLFWTVKTR